MGEEILLHLLHVRRGEIDLVDGDDERHAGVLRVGDRLDRLRHDGVVGRDDQDDDVGHLGAAGAHRRERLVARCVEERDRASLLRHDLVGADVLRDAARFPGHDGGLADVVEQRRLAVIYVPHHRDDRRARVQRLGALGLPLLGCLRDVLLLAHRLEAERRSDQLDHVEVEALVDRDHLAELFEGERHDLGRRDLEDVRELGDGDELGHAHQGLLTLFLLATLFLLQVAEARAFLTVPDALATDRSFDRGQGAGDVLRHRFLIDHGLAALLALLALVAAPLVERHRPGRRRGDGPRRNRAAGRSTRHGLGADGRRDDRAR